MSCEVFVAIWLETGHAQRLLGENCKRTRSRICIYKWITLWRPRDNVAINALFYFLLNYTTSEKRDDDKLIKQKRKSKEERRQDDVWKESGWKIRNFNLSVNSPIEQTSRESDLQLLRMQCTARGRDGGAFYYRDTGDEIRPASQKG